MRPLQRQVVGIDPRVTLANEESLGVSHSMLRIWAMLRPIGWSGPADQPRRLVFYDGWLFAAFQDAAPKTG